uniref:Uncharacterized protein n=1 Tax=Parascaris univalens TaxID=6257 RepID=A0A915ATB2_PARUN
LYRRKVEEDAEAIVPSIQNGRQALRREITTKPLGTSLTPLTKGRQQKEALIEELEEKIKEMERALKELEEDKRSHEAELEAVRQDLEKACAHIAHLSKVNAELSKQEVAIKRNGQYTDELKACLCHLKKAGVPDAKCGEVIITVGVLLGKKVVGEEAGGMNGK